MPDDGKEVHPGSFVGDSIEEFKKLPTWGKVGIGLVFVVVIYLAIKSRQQSVASTSSAGAPSGQAGNPPLGQGGAGIQTVPGGSTGQVPVLPGGLCPQYDPSGNLVAFAPCGQSGTTSGTGGNQGGGTGGNTGGGTGGTGGLQGGNPPVGGTVNTSPWLWQQLGNAGFGNPLIPSGQYKGPSFSNLKPGTYYNYGGTNYLLTTSVKGAPGGGILYGINPQGKTVPLYGPPSAYHAVASPAVTQPGGRNGATQVPATRVS